MSNMGYCRFYNTANDLADCVDHWDDELSPREALEKRVIVEMAIDILEREGYFIQKG